MVSLLTLGIAHASMALPSLNRSLLNYSLIIAVGDHSTFNNQQSTLLRVMNEKTKNVIWKFIELILAMLAGGGTAYMMM
jgi:hypothetical protein